MVCKATVAAYRRLREATRAAWVADVAWAADVAWSGGGSDGGGI